MPFNRPSLFELRRRVFGDIDAGLPASEPRLKRSLLGVLGVVLVGGFHSLYGYLQWLSRQLLPDTADSESLDRHASIHLDGGRKPATSSAGLVDLVGVDGTAVPAGTILQRADGWGFSTDELVTIGGGVASVSVTAVKPGADSNTAAAVSLAFVSPVAGVNSVAVVGGDGLVGGADTEGDDALRARVLSAVRKPAHGGAEWDYERWALEVPGVTRAWVYPGEGGIGKVVVRFVMDGVYADGIPLAADVSIVQNYIDRKRPVTAAVTVLAPVARPLNLAVQLAPNNATVQAAVEAELTDMLKRVGSPGGTIPLSYIREAISLAPGETDHVLNMPGADVVHAVGELPVLGGVSWQ